MAHYVVRPLSRLQTLVARNMYRAQQETAHATLHAACDVTALLLALRERQTETRAVSAYVMHACIQALQEHPDLNAHLADRELCIYEKVKLGVMLEADQGVIVGCIPEAARLTPAELARAVEDLAARANDRKLQVEETRGATFMVADLSAYPVDYFTPILLPSALAILGIGRTRRVCWPTDQGCQPASQLSLSLTFDHRGSDGIRAGRFLASIVRRLEHPASFW